MSMYYLRSGFRSGGDEAQMADILNIPKSNFEIPFALIFINCFIAALRSLRDWRTILKWIIALLIGSILTGLGLMKADAVVRMQVNLENPLFRPVFGFSFPVLLVYALALVGVFVFWNQQKR